MAWNVTAEYPCRPERQAQRRAAAEAWSNSCSPPTGRQCFGYSVRLAGTVIRFTTGDRAAT